MRKDYTIEDLRAMVQEIREYSDELDYLDVWENDQEFFETFFQGRELELARSICYGDYNYMDEWVRFNGYGNLESLSDWEADKEIEDYADEILEIYNRLLEDGEIEEIDF